MANRFPLVVDTTDSNKIKELPSGDDLNLSGSDIINVVNVTASGTLQTNTLSVTTSNFTVNGSSLASVAISGSYNDLSNKPTLFSGNYADLTGKPTLKTTIESLDNVGSTSPTNNQVLRYDTALGRYEPSNIGSIALQGSTLEDIGDVTFAGDKTGDVVKWSGGGWTNARVDYSELTSVPTTLSGYGISDAQTLLVSGTNIKTINGQSILGSGNINVTGSGGPGDGVIEGSNYKINIVGSDSTLLVDQENSAVPFAVLSGTPTTIAGYGITEPVVLSDSSIAAQPVKVFYANQAAFPSASDWHGALAHSHSDGAMYFAHGGSWNKLANASESATSSQGAKADTAVQPAALGSFTFTGTTLDSDDSSSITVTPAVTFESDLAVENDLTVTNNISCATITVSGELASSGAGTPELFSSTDIRLTAGTSSRVEVTQSPFKVANMTTTERNAITAENGDIIYNTTDNKFQGYENGSWANLI